MEGFSEWFRSVLDEIERGARYAASIGDSREGELDDLLRDIAAKRALLDVFDEPTTVQNVEQEEGLLRAVQIIGTAYAGWPGYREEWRPADG